MGEVFFGFLIRFFSIKFFKLFVYVASVKVAVVALRSEFHFHAYIDEIAQLQLWL